VKVSKATVSLWENDTNVPNGRNLQELAKVLKTSSEWILSGKDSLGPSESQSSDLIPIYQKQTCPASEAPGNPVRHGLDGYKRLLGLGDSVFAYQEDSIGMEPRIMKGEIVIIDMSPFDVISGQTYLLDIGGNLVLACVCSTPSGLIATFLSSAPGWEAIPVSRDSIKGRMVAFIPDFS
jgi:transcriptional regulator with XRE-family HTH domain